MTRDQLIVVIVAFAIIGIAGMAWGHRRSYPCRCGDEFRSADDLMHHRRVTRHGE